MTQRNRLAVSAAVAVAVWRILALLHPSSMIEQTPGFAIPLAAMGLLFVVAGLIVFHVRRGHLSSLYLAWCLCSGVHWGGSVGFDSASVELFLLLVYIGVSVAGEAALLHLALSYPRAWSAPAWIIRSLYVPGIAAAAMAPLAAVVSTQLVGIVIGVVLLVGNVFGLSAGVVFIIRLAREDRGSPQRRKLSIVVACLVIGGAPALLASLGLLPGPGDAYNLLSILVPLGLGYALAR